MEHLIENKSSETLWVLIKIQNKSFAIDSNYVESILQLDEKITKCPNSDDKNIGIIDLRGQIIKIMDFRKFLGMDSLKEEQEEFEQMLEQRKIDHTSWVNSLKNSIENKIPFSLATDPHKCAFGKWYDNFETDNQTVAFHMRKIDDPHRKLHESANKLIEICHSAREECEKEKVASLIARESEPYMHEVVSLLDSAKTVFKDSYHNMCVILSNGLEFTGLLVDEVTSAEQLIDFADSNSIFGSDNSTIVSHIAKRKNSNDQVLVIDLSKIFTTHQNF